MKIFVVNPNSTASMTETIRLSAVRAAAPGTQITVATVAGAPASIEGYADEARAVPGTLDAIRLAEAQGAQATVIACFDDPGLSAAREVATGPVIGICQAGIQVAMTIAARFSIVTTLPRSVPIIEDLVDAYGASRQCRSVRSVNLPVLALEEDPETAFARLRTEIRRAINEDGAEAVVLGCAGMAEMCRALQLETGVPVIDGVSAAVKLAEAMVGGGFATAKTGSFAFPRDKSLMAATHP
ncbi:aspartate/glutamate racemase family protein [Pararhodobacter zhoushanensis]|uniref:aspartate/glutamate racemase family protein n=1 Tax=Pararhodobacter zhoushanensis TaxID=2479545 RepID=UPI000F8CA444|nr:aspartate/glutamate racemase family protein [Pararhodobacter zhoushanensis]